MKLPKVVFFLILKNVENAFLKQWSSLINRRTVVVHNMSVCPSVRPRYYVKTGRRNPLVLHHSSLLTSYTATKFVPFDTGEITA